MRRVAACIAVAAACALPAAASAQVKPYRADDGGGFRNVLPPGSNGLANGPELVAFLSTGARPAHNDDQRDMYADLVYAVPGLKDSDLDRFFKDASFGVKPEDVARTYQPREDVTVVRDASFGVPHVYGSTRDGAMFGLGYVTAEDRLFFIDVLRHLGRAQLSSFAGGAQGNRNFDRDQWALAPYTEADLQKQIELGVATYGAEGELVKRDSENYVAGVNAYISEAQMNPGMMPGEYPAIGRPQGPDPWKPTDIIATAALVGGIFGRGGGGELGSAVVRQDFEHRFGRKRGARYWSDFRSGDDPEALPTVRKTFKHNTPPKKARGVAMPDRGSVENVPIVSAGGTAEARGQHTGILGPGFKAAFPRSASNALLVSARKSASGRPLAVFGPQTGYFAPQILMEQDVHAPGLDARGVAFPGTNLYVQLGRGRDYAWSATSAGNDNIDTFAVELCESDGRQATRNSRNYLFRGTCTPMEVLQRTNSWEPNLADSTPAGSETLTALRTKLGIVFATATIRGKPVAYTRLRSTYFHETESAGGFSDLNNPDKIRGPQDFQRAAARIGYTFNWFYADHRSIAYFNSANLPLRPRGWHPDFPMHASMEWRSWDPDRWAAPYEGPATHPQVVDQAYLTNWNNKQAPGYRADDGRFNYGSVDRGQLLDDRVRAGTAGAKKMTLTQLVEAMEDAGTVDLRGDKDLPLALALLGKPNNARLADAVAKLRAWNAGGSHRRDLDRDGRYEHSEAIAIMDAWWPRWVRAQFEPLLGRSLYRRIVSHQGLDNEPHNHGDHLGSAYDDGWYGFVHKDLRRLLGRRVRGWTRTWCGGGSRRLCRRDLEDALAEALDEVAAGKMYQGDSVCRGAGRDGDQRCWDSVWFRPLGGVTQPVIPWINRPTFQQVVEVQGPAPR